MSTAFVYVHHEVSDTSVRVELPSTPMTAAYVVTKAKEAAPKLAGKSFAVSLDGEVPISGDDDLMSLNPKDDVFLLDLTPDAATAAATSSVPAECPKTGKPRTLYIHVFNTPKDEEPVISTRKKFRPEQTRDELLSEVFTLAAIESLKRAGEDIVTKYHASEESEDETVWASGTLPCFPAGGDVFIYGNPSVPGPSKPKAAAAKAPSEDKKKPPTVQQLKSTSKPFEDKRRYVDAAKVWEEAIAAATPLLALEFRRELAAMWLERAKVPRKAIKVLEALKQDTEDSNGPEHARCMIGLGKAYFLLRRYDDAGDELLGALKFMQQANIPSSDEVQKDLKLNLGAAWFKAGRQEGIKIIQETLGGDVSSTFGVMHMSQAYALLGHPDDALQWAVTLVVRDQKSKELKENFALIVAQISDAVERIEKNILNRPGPDIATAWGFLGLIARDHGVMSASEKLYAKSLEIAPAHANLMLNYSHLFEQMARPKDTLKHIMAFYRRNNDLSVQDTAKVSDVLPLLETAYRDVLSSDALTFYDEVIRCDSDERVNVHENTAENHAMKRGMSGTWDPPGTTRAGGVTPGKRQCTDQELGVVGMHFTIIKVLFTLGRLDTIPPLIRVIDACRHLEKIARTIMKNEHSYYTTVALVMQFINDPKLPDPRPLLADPHPTKNKLYVVGDSHSIPMSWQVLNLQGEQYLTVNRLVTGLKLYHLRDEGVFYPKHNFEAVTKTLPEGADALFCFGEIDCREGIAAAVEKGYHDTPKDAIAELLDIYMKKLLAVKKARKLRRVYVLAPLPVLDVTRHIVVGFNQFLTGVFSTVKDFIMVDTTDRILCQADGDAKPHEMATGFGESRVLRPELGLDTTHINPCYVSKFLEPAMNEALEKRAGQ